MNATSPLGKFLAAIAGKLDKSKLPTPSNEAEYYLNEIARKDSGSGGGVLIVHMVNNTLDKTMGEIKEAWDRGDRIDIVLGDDHYAPIIFTDVHYDGRGDPPGYIGSVRIASTSGDMPISYKVNEATEAAALNAYPTRNT